MIEKIINEAFEIACTNDISQLNKKEVYDATYAVLEQLNNGTLRVVEKNIEGNWEVKEYVKKALSLFFKFSDKVRIGADPFFWYDKVPLKQFSIESARVVPGSIVRFGAYVSDKAVLCPSYVNVGAYIDDYSMIDSFSTIGSSSVIGKNCHISEGVCIGGVLEPINATPVIIEENCFIGAKAVITEGVVVKKNSIVAASTTLTQSTKIFLRETGEVIHGYIPEDMLVVPGSYKTTENLQINCAIAMSRKKHKDIINDLLR